MGKYLNTFIKLIIFIGLGFVLYKQVFTDTDVRNALASLRENLIHGRGWFVLVLLLCIVNWTIETLKWKFLVNKLTFIHFKEAFLGILLGISFSLFTPNRLGEYGGRVLVLKDKRIAAIVSTLVGSYAQIVVNMSIGGLATLVYLWKYLHLNFYLVLSAIVLYVLLFVFLIVSYFNLDIFSIIFNKYNIFKKIAGYVDVVKRYTDSDLRLLLIFSVARYATYSIQFFLLLKVFRVGLHFWDGLVLIPNVFFVQSILPTMAILDIPLRSQVALQFIKDAASGGILQIVATSIVLWFVNLIIPSMLGGLLSIFYRFEK